MPTRRAPSDRPDAAGERALSREVSGSTTWNIVNIVRRTVGEDGVARLLERAGQAHRAAEIEDEDAWSTFEQTRRLLEAAAEVLDDPHAARRVGTAIARSDMTSEVVAVLRTLGSPAELYRSIRDVAARYCTVVEMAAVEVGDGRALIAASSIPGYPRFSHLCDFTAGLLAQAPVPFDLPPASVRELECELRGDDRCLFEATWLDELPLEPSPEVRVAMLEDQLDVLESRFEALQQLAADLVEAGDLDELLARITERAGTAVRAPRHLLVVDLDGVRHVAHSGTFADDLDAAVEEVLAADPADADGCRLVAVVASAGRTYGRLAAVYDEGIRFFPAERLLLSTYARLAAVALDAATSLDAARREADTATSLLQLARALATPRTEDEVMATLAAWVPGVAGGTAGAACRWHPSTADMEIVAVSGLDPDLAAAVRSMRVRAADSPVLRALVADPRPRIIDRREPDLLVSGLLELSGQELVGCVPIVAGRELIGLVAAGFTDDQGAGHHLFPRLEGVADLAATTIVKARLLERVRCQAMFDELTGLPNRRLLEDRIEMALAGWRRRGERFALCFVDLDRFKPVNDELGHAVGDRVLVEMGRRLSAALREEDTIARVGGDEFALLLPGIDQEAALEQVADKVATLLSEPFLVGDLPVPLGASLGFALAPRHGTDSAELLRNADAAMYRAKRSGSRWALFTPGMRAGAGDRLKLEVELRQALAREELAVHYQPEIDLGDHSLATAEALVRWNHPERGELRPDDFLALASEIGLIADLDRWVLRQACRQMRQWERTGTGPARVAVNLSGRTLQEPAIAAWVDEALREAQLPAAALELEITESALEPGTDDVYGRLWELKALGVRLALDDFGTGHSGLSRLQRFPFDSLKIDQSFVAALHDGEGAEPLLAGMLSLGLALGVQVVAEGVETADQADFLRRHGCHLAQGYLFGRPRPA